MKTFIMLLILCLCQTLVIAQQNTIKRSVEDKKQSDYDIDGSGLIRNLKSNINNYSDSNINAHKKNIVNALDASELTIPSFTKVTSGPIATDEALSLGCSWADYDDDGDLDLFVSNNSEINNALYSNNGDGTFDRISTGIVANDGGNSTLGMWGDYNNDGNIDLFVSNQTHLFNTGDNYFYKNNGDNTFTKIITGSIVNDGGTSFGAAWGDINNDGSLDMFVVNQVDEEANYLYINNGDDTFTKITNGDIVNITARSYSGYWGDYDNDDDLDLFVANSFGANNFLYNNNGDGTFTTVTTGEIVTDGGSSIGGNWVDYDNDGDLDLYVSNVAGENNFLYENNGDGTFTKITSVSIVNDSTHTLSSSWVDIDNDGDLDVYLTTLNHNLMYLNNGDKTFTQVVNHTITDESESSRGCSWADYDNDGDMDLFVSNYGPANSLYTNDGNSNNWVNIKCDGSGSNKSGIGTKVWLKAKINGSPVWQFRQINLQSGYVAQNSLNVEFGLGDAQAIDSLLIKWTSGLTEAFDFTGVNQFYVTVEGQGTIVTSVDNSEGNGNGVSSFTLSQNYPNPFNPSTKIKFEIPGQARNDNMPVTLKIYDVLGNEVATLVNEEKPAGTYEVDFNAVNLTSGVYFYKLTAGSFVQTKKMILLR